MDITEKTINVFVLGDLVLDHAIFVKPKKKAYQPVGSEKVFEVIRRIDTAGGAANCARVLASLSRGRTILWGIAGRSPWGPFLHVLQSSQVYDAAASNIFFRGLHDEGIAMNTITRIITREGERQEHESRFDDVGYVSVTEDHVRNAITHLKNENKDSGIHVVIFNDLDMNTLSRSLVKGIADFALGNGIPVFVDPKRDLTKYQGISATAIVPNFKEWCELIGEGGRDDYWRACLGNATGLERIARRSLRHLPNFAYHIIKCDADGAVIIGPSENRRHRYSIYQISPHAPLTEHRKLPHQLGCGDVLTAIMALEYASADPGRHPTQRILQAFLSANAVVACYREMSWHRMPTRDDVIRLTTPFPSTGEPVIITDTPRYLPTTSSVNMRDVKTRIPGLFSSDKKYKDSIKDLVEFFTTGWEESLLKSAILTARGGCGKTVLCNGLQSVMGKDIGVVEFDSEIERGKLVEDIASAVEKTRSDLLHGNRNLLLTVDEAFGRGIHLFGGKSGVLVLEAAHSRRSRFLLIDADFETYRDRLSGSQFMSRCKVFELPSLSERPKDIVYVFIAGCFAAARQLKIERIICEQSVLLGIIDWVLGLEEREQSPRSVFAEGKGTFSRASKEYQGSGDLTVRLEHLGEVVKARGANDSSDESFIEFLLPVGSI